MKQWCLLISATGLIACTEPPIKEYFCEAYVREGESQFYQQQIVQMKNEELCVLGRSDQPVCAFANQDTSTPWRAQGTRTQTREITRLKLNKNTMSMDIEQESRSADEAQPVNPTAVVSIHYEFQKTAGTLIQSTQGAAQPTVYACKPWAKRAWWQVY